MNEVNINVSMTGRFKFVKRDVEDNVVEETPWFDNIVLNTGLNRIGTGSYLIACQVGSGNAPPTATQTTLTAYVGGTSTIQSTSTSAQSTPPYYGKIVRTFRFAAGVATGTLAEVGVGWTTTTGNLFCRALILDVNGNPTTITVLSDEVLDVVYELRLYPDLVDKVFVASISGSNYNCVLRTENVTTTLYWATLGSAFNTVTTVRAYNGALGDVTVLPSGTTSNVTITTLGAYVNNSYSNTLTNTFGLNDGNLSGGIAALSIPTSVGSYKVSFSPPIPKTLNDTLVLVYRFTWNRYSP